MTDSANGMSPTNPGRLYHCNWVIIEPLFDNLPRYVIQDTGVRVWINVGHSELDELPQNVTTVTDGSDPCDVDGNRIMSFPAEWCKFIDDDTAETILRCHEASETLKEYAH